jgi:hypothetical protein
MNPDIGVDGLFALSQFSKDPPVVFEGGHDPKVNGFNIQQVELTFASNVDPYLRADAALVLTSEGIEIEEAYATTLGLPLDLQLKAGQFFTAFGRFNPTHPHAWDFANKPLVMGRFFGGDGLRNPGAQLSWLTPLPWYSEFIGSVQNSTGETVQSFNPDREGVPTAMRSLSEALYLARWSNFFAITDSISLNLGASYVQGGNAAGPGLRTRIVGGDIFLKYRQPDALSFVTLQLEALQRYYGTSADETFKDFGWYAQLDFRLPSGYERWHLGARYDQVGPTDSRHRISPVVTFYPSEFSKVRLQYDYDKLADVDTAQHVAILQLEFMIGAHAAHKF